MMGFYERNRSPTDAFFIFALLFCFHFKKLSPLYQGDLTYPKARLKLYNSDIFKNSLKDFNNFFITSTVLLSDHSVSIVKLCCS